MGLLTGSASVTRCTVTSRPDVISFDAAGFEEIVPGASLRERVGFVPFEPGAGYQIGQRRWAFRVRIDTLKPDPTRVQERLKDLVRSRQEESGDPHVSTRMRRELRQLAEEELLLTTSPRSRVIECCLDDHTLWIGTTANAHLGTVLGLLYQVNVVADFRTPWLDHGDETPPSDVVDAKEPWQSLLGCRFLRRLLEDVDIMVEPQSGAASLVTREARVNLSGAVVNDLLHYVERGAVLLSAKLVAGEVAFRLDALNYRLSSIRVQTEVHEQWQDLLDERLEKIDAMHELLDRKYAAMRPRLVS